MQVAGCQGEGAPATPASVPLTRRTQHTRSEGLLFDTKTHSVRHPCPTSSTGPFCSAAPASRLEQMADDPRAHLLTFARVAVYPPGAFACISMRLARVVFHFISSQYTQFTTHMHNCEISVDVEERATDEIHLRRCHGSHLTGVFWAPLRFCTG